MTNTPNPTPSERRQSARLDDQAATALRERYMQLGALWYSWLHGPESAARESLSAVLGRPVLGKVEHVLWDALLDVVGHLMDGHGANVTWLRSDARGWLSHSLVNQLVRDCHGPTPAHVRSNWTQHAVLEQVTRDIRRLESAGEVDAAAELATSARAFLRRWVELIPDELLNHDIGWATPDQREAYRRAWPAAKADLRRDVRELTVKSA